jgi:hypothetical protein
VRANHSNPPSEDCKSFSGGRAENPAATAGSPGRLRPPDTAERARRLALIRAALAGTAPEFHARALRDREGRR